MKAKDMSRFNKFVNTEGDCWEWEGRLDPYGYGIFSISGRRLGAHRISYEAAFGSIPAGLNILHKCNNRACVRPDHLYAGTQKDNMQDRVDAGNGPGEFTNSEVIAIRGALRLTKLTYAQIAKLFKVDERLIQNIALGKTYKGVM